MEMNSRSMLAVFIIIVTLGSSGLLMPVLAESNKNVGNASEKEAAAASFDQGTAGFSVSGGSVTSLNFFLQQEPDWYLLTIGVDGLPPALSANVSVDEQRVGSIMGGALLKLRLRPGPTHVVALDELVSLDQGTRFRANVSKMAVNHSGEYIFAYEPEYSVTFTTFPEGIATVGTDGWLRKGETAESFTAPSVVENQTGVRYVFDSWTTGEQRLEENPGRVVVDAPLILTAHYRIQYLLRIESEFGSPKGAGWYDAGSQARISVENTVGYGVRQVFDGWSGNASSNSPQIDVTVDSPMTLVARWRVDYSQILIAAFALGLTSIVLAYGSRRVRKQSSS